jgi:hypothetical protein
MFTEDPVTGGLTYHDHGVVNLPESIGLGASISEERLANLEHVII